MHLRLCHGGGGGIRTHVTVSRKHAFQACAFSHSATPPYRLARRRTHTLGHVDMRGRWAIFPAMRRYRTGTVGRHYSRHNRSDKALSQSQAGCVGSPAGARRGIRTRPLRPLAKPRRRPHCESHMDESLNDYLVRPDPRDPRLTQRVRGIDHTGAPIETGVVVERALTIFLNGQEIVTAMTINDYPEYLALGYLLNQNMLQANDVVTGVDYDEELAVVVVRTERATNYEQKLKKKVQTSGCAQGTVFGDLMEVIETAQLPTAELRTSWLYALTGRINTTPSLYLEAGAIHGCVLAQRDRPLVYMEDVGRHNAVDKIAGWMFRERVLPDDKIFYTTGRLTSEMVIKTVRMGIPILVSRSGFTAWGVELARKANLTLIGRARGKRFTALAGEDRIVFDQDLAYVEDESAKHRRKAAVHDE